MENLNETDENGELKKLAPTLFGIKRETPFSVPDNYFETLSNSILERRLEETKKLTGFEKVIAFSEIQLIIQRFRRPQFSLAVAAGVIVILLGTFRFLHTSRHSNEPICFTAEEVAGTLDMETLDEEIISDALAVSESKTISVPSKNAGSSDKSEIEDYLLNTNIDLNLISNEL